MTICHATVEDLDVITIAVHHTELNSLKGSANHSE